MDKEQLPDTTKEQEELSDEDQRFIARFNLEPESLKYKQLAYEETE